MMAMSCKCGDQLSNINTTYYVAKKEDGARMEAL